MEQTPQKNTVERKCSLMRYMLYQVIKLNVDTGHLLYSGFHYWTVSQIETGLASNCKQWQFTICTICIINYICLLRNQQRQFTSNLNYKFLPWKYMNHVKMPSRGFCVYVQLIIIWEFYYNMFHELKIIKVVFSR